MTPEVVLITLSGLRPDAINSDNTPNLQQAMMRGASTMTAESVMPSLDLPCYTSLFYGVAPDRHGILSDGFHPMATPVTGLVEHLKTYRKRTGFIYNWDALRDMVPPGFLSFNFFIDTHDELDGDEIMADTAAHNITNAHFDLTYVSFTTIDLAGHRFGWMSDGYLQQVKLVDDLLGRVLATITDRMYVIIQGDHGGHDRTHGTDSAEDFFIPYILLGPTVRHDFMLQEPVSLLDTAPTICHLLNVPVHAKWDGNVISEAFVD